MYYPAWANGETAEFSVSLEVLSADRLLSRPPYSPHCRHSAFLHSLSVSLPCAQLVCSLPSLRDSKATFRSPPLATPSKTSAPPYSYYPPSVLCYHSTNYMFYLLIMFIGHPSLWDGGASRAGPSLRCSQPYFRSRAEQCWHRVGTQSTGAGWRSLWKHLLRSLYSLFFKAQYLLLEGITTLSESALSSDEEAGSEKQVFCGHIFLSD